MRRFHSYGPVDERYHFCVGRADLVDRCTAQMTGMDEDGGRFFTLWAPRQTGKTWLMRRVTRVIQERYPDRFAMGSMSMQGVIMEDDDPDAVFFRQIPRLFRDSFSMEIEPPDTWDGWVDLFSRDRGCFDRPVLLFIDEFDSLPRSVIDRLVTLFRDMYMKRDNYRLHGLALIGVRAVLGVESLRGSPFNIQRSLHVPNFSREEVVDLFNQYRSESNQTVVAEVVNQVYEATRGQPGLVCWFGELLTETYHPGPDQPIDLDCWEHVHEAALHTEWNNTVLNLVKKARSGYQDHVLALFARPNTPFSLDAEWCAYLYLNGVIDSEIRMDEQGGRDTVCRFSSPFVQERLYNALTHDLVGDRLPILALEPLDDLSDVFAGPGLDLPSLLNRYKAYLGRLKAKGLTPWKDQPRRTDLHLTEAVGHFHLYAWLKEALEGLCVISPEFPAGNGKVDLHLKCDTGQGIIEVKSFRSKTRIEAAKVQAAAYSRNLGLPAVTLAVFAPVEDPAVIEQLSARETIDGIEVAVVAIGWV